MSADEFLAFERLLVELSSKFANLAAEEFEVETDSALLRIREFLGFDRSTFAEFMADGSQTLLCRRDRQADRKYSSSAWVRTKLSRRSPDQATVSALPVSRASPPQTAMA